jgi:hypothetical protein
MFKLISFVWLGVTWQWSIHQGLENYTENKRNLKLEIKEKGTAYTLLSFFKVFQHW